MAMRGGARTGREVFKFDTHNRYLYASIPNKWMANRKYRGWCHHRLNKYYKKLYRVGSSKQKFFKKKTKITAYFSDGCMTSSITYISHGVTLFTHFHIVSQQFFFFFISLLWFCTSAKKKKKITRSVDYGRCYNTPDVY